MSLKDIILKTKIQALIFESFMKELSRKFIFYRFKEDDQPIVVYENGEVLLRWHEYTLTMKDVTELMEEVGYISKDNFEL